MENKKPIFQRRHYEKIAEILNKSQVDSNGFLSKRKITADLIDLFKQDNCLFNEERFIKAVKD